MSNVWVFFYGTFMSSKILRKNGIKCKKTFPAKVSGYSLTIRPRVNLLSRENSYCYGGLAFVMHSELDGLYKKVHKLFGQRYYPYPVMAELEDGLYRQALCFIADPFDSGDPQEQYINEMVECAKEMDAPKSYIKHIKSFKLNKTLGLPDFTEIF